MKVNNNIVAVFEILDGKVKFLGLSKNFEEEYKITTVTTNREIYYKKLDDCNENELKRMSYEQLADIYITELLFKREGWTENKKIN